VYHKKGTSLRRGIMVEKRNRILLGILCLAFVIYFVTYSYPFFMIRNLSMLLLGLAFFLLYEKKKMGWALWLGIFLLGTWISRQARGIPFLGSSLTASVFWLLLSVLLLKKYQDTHWQGYVLPGCFALWTGIYIAVASLPFFNQHGFWFLVAEIVSAFFMSGQIKKKGASITKALCLSGILFAIFCALIFARTGLVIPPKEMII
jgi:hypothetical protein